MAGMQDVETAVRKGNGFAQQFPAVALENDIAGRKNFILYNPGLFHTVFC